MNKYNEAKDFQNIREVIEYCTERHAEKPVFIIKNKAPKGVKFDNLPEEEKYTKILFKDMKRHLDAIGTAMIARGLKDHRIAVIGKNCYEWILSYYSTVNGVGLVIPIDPAIPEQEIENSLAISEADTILYHESLEAPIRNILESGTTKLQNMIPFGELYTLISEGEKLLDEGDRSYLDAEIDKDKMSILLFTSGTTSNSKAVMLSHYNIANNIYGLQIHEDVCRDDVGLALLPYHHTFGCTGQLIFMCAGATTAFCDGLKYIQKNFAEYQVTAFFCVPLVLESIHKKVLKNAEKTGKLSLMRKMQKVSRILMKLGIDKRKTIFKSVHEGIGGNFRLLISGAAGVSPEVQRDFYDWGILTVNGYGLTETSPVIASESPAAHRERSVGKPMATVEVRIDNPDEDGIGEICAKGANVMLGYYKNQEATDEVIRDGWFHTGDYGKMDKDGYLYITGRKKNVIVLKNGKNIYPEELEATVEKFPYVGECIVFGSNKFGDPVIATKIVLDKEYLKENYPGVAEETAMAEIRGTIWNDIKAFNETLPSFKHITYLNVDLEPMVKTSTAKVKRQIEIDKLENTEGALEHISQA
ncbi:MAG: AMP-binding protein [Clostridiales bacterium]|nr:AMP-binding protein [Candidatus Crickella merdequi]